MLAEGSLGDAYGAGFEFASREKIDQFNTLERYEQHPRYPSIYKRYTDDTQLAIAIAEYIADGLEWTHVGLANKFIEAFKRDPREGYGSGMYKALTTSSNGKEFIRNLDRRSKRNGAVMRVYPIGIYPHVNHVLEYAAIQASVTHDTPEAITSAQAVALMMHYCYYRKGTLHQLPQFLSDIQGIHWNTTWKNEVQIDAIQSTEAVLSVLVQSPPSLKNILLNSVALGGDVDTVASLALAIASQADEVDQHLPPWMYTDIENSEYGLSYIQALDSKLLALFNRVHS